MARDAAGQRAARNGGHRPCDAVSEAAFAKPRVRVAAELCEQIATRPEPLGTARGSLGGGLWHRQRRAPEVRLLLGGLFGCIHREMELADGF